MAAFVSNTPQIQSPYAWTFAGLQVEEGGACWAVERSALRDIKPKALLVRYPNPFRPDREPEIVYESSDPFDAYWRSPKGEHHVLGKKHHFQDAKGKWKTKELAKRPQRLVHVAGFGDRVLIALGWPAGLLELRDGEYRPIDIGDDQMAEGITGVDTDDVYVPTASGVNHFDGATWTRVAKAPRNMQATCVAKDLVYATGNEPERGRVFALYRGNAKDGFEGLLPRLPGDGPGLERPFYALGSLHLMVTGAEERGLYRFDDERATVEQIARATGYTGHGAGTDEVLWFDNGIELLCTDGDSWKKVLRIHHDKSKA